MRRTALALERQVDRAELGSWKVSPSKSLPFGIIPFIKGREDFEAVFRQPDLLSDGQPIEISGFGVESILRRAAVLEMELGREDITRSFTTLVREHPPVVSFPPDLVWLAHDDVVNVKLKDSLEKTLPASSLALTSEDTKQIAETICSNLVANPQKFAFWLAMTRRDSQTSLPYTRLLIEYSVTAATRARALGFGGLIPPVDSQTPGSVDWVHRLNLATAEVVRDRLNDGISTPPYLYTIGVNSSAFLADTPSPTLESLLADVRAALTGAVSDYFDGIHLTIRGLSRISLSGGRTNVAIDFISRLGAIAQAAGVPLWWSRPGILGLPGHDAGCSFTSYSPNLGVEDLYTTGGPPPGDPQSQFGKVLNSTQRAIWDYRQVTRAMNGPDGGLPDLGLARHFPNDDELSSARRYRIHFSKPYTVAAFRHLWVDWRQSILQGETTPGREYIQSFEAPFNQWGLR